MLPFADVADADEVANSTVRHWLTTVLGRGGAHSVQLLALLILARILVPEDFGLIAMVMSVIGVAHIFRDLGLSAATIRQPHITHSQVSTLFWINLLFGGLVSALAMACAPLLAQLYADPRATQVTMVLACTFFISGAGTQHMALLRRHLKFKRLAVISVMGMLVGQGSAVALAFAGQGYWALVAGMLIGSVTNTAMAWLLCRWLPGRPHWDAQVRSMLSFGGYLIIFTLMGFVAMNMPNVLIGSLWGAAAVGFYSRAYTLLTMFLNYVVDPLNIVAPAGLSRLLDSPAAYRDYYLDTTNMMLLLTAPIGFACLVAAPDIVRVALGPQWDQTGILLRILSLAVVPQTLCATSGWLYMSHGDSRRMMFWGVGGWGALIAMLAVGSLYGAHGVAWSYVVGMCLLLYPCMRLAYAVTRIRLMDLLRISWPVVLAALMAGIPALWLSGQMAAVSVAARLPAVLLAYAMAYLLLLLCVFKQKPVLMRYWAQLRRRAAV